MTDEQGSRGQDKSTRYWVSTGYWLLDVLLTTALIAVVAATAAGAALGYLN